MAHLLHRELARWMAALARWHLPIRLELHYNLFRGWVVPASKLHPTQSTRRTMATEKS